MPRFVFFLASTASAWVLIAGLCRSTPAADTPASSDYKHELPRIAAVEPRQALATFKVAPGFRMDQVAAEPLVNSPVAMAFDDDSRLFVVEMRGYSENRDDALSRVSLLTDTDGDGHFDRSSVYVDKLLWPVAVACWDGGIFVGDPPDIWYFKDTNGDGQADVRRKFFTGFGTSNVQGLMNSFTWTLDNRIEVAASSTGGDIVPCDDQGNPRKDVRPLSIRGRDFRFDPRTLQFEATSGGLQHGMSFDDWGHKFLSGNSNHIQQVMYEDRYLVRAPWLAAPPARIDIAADGPQAEVFRASPVEPWRLVRTRLRVSGAVKGAIEGGGRAAGYFTGATGVTIYRGTAFPKESYGMAVVGDVGSNLIHRKRLTLEGLQYLAQRIDPHSEFVASTDIWFRPAQFANAPDGTLYVADMYREVIEHPASLPPEIKQHLDLTSGRDRGRIYRVLPDAFTQPALPKLGHATPAELVALLAHPNAWHRQTASRLLYERRDDKTAVPLLRRLAAESSSPLGRMQALYALDGCGALGGDVVLRGLNDSDARVRAQAVRLSERLGDLSSAVRARLYELADDSDMQVRYQLAFTLGLIPPATGHTPALVKLARKDGADRWVRFALLTSLRGAESLNTLLADESFRHSEPGRQVLAAMATGLGQTARAPEVVAFRRAVDELPQEDDPLATALVRGFADGVLRSGRSPRSLIGLPADDKTARLLARSLARAKKIAADEKQSLSARVAAVGTLVFGTFDESRDVLASLLDQRQPQELQQAVLVALEKFRAPGVATLLLEAWPTLSPRMRVAASDALFARPERLTALLDAVEKGSFQPGELESPRIQFLLSHPNADIRQRAQRLLGSIKLGRRQDVVDSYRSVLSMTGNAARGKVTFQKICAACHRAEGVGHEIGPNLATVKNRGTEFILFNVLDPSREVNPQYVNYVAVTEDGRTLSGMIAAETASSITLRRAEGAIDTILRSNLEELRSTGLSIMPEGLEKQIDRQGMADVIAYLLTLK